LSDISYEMVDEIPDRKKPSSQYDPIADLVRKTGKVARVASSKGSLHTLASRLRGMYKDLDVKARTTEDGYFVYLAPKTKEKSK
jgi:hypothetical protein